MYRCIFLSYWSVEIIEVTEFSEEIFEAFQRLTPQLSKSNPAPSKEALTKIINSEACHLLIAIEDDYIWGSLSLVVFRIPTGLRAWVEDVVVDSEARGKGVGSMLSQAALDLAKDLGASTVDLTSRPSREAANRLYKRLGFEKRETNVYRFSIGDLS